MNLANSNLVTFIGGVGQTSAGGALGATLTYNSKARDLGLRGNYTTSGGTTIVDRIDPTLDFNWGSGGPTPTSPPGQLDRDVDRMDHPSNWWTHDLRGRWRR